MKKVFAIALVLCLVMGAVFAAKGDIKVGAQLGYVNGFYGVKTYADSDNYMKITGSAGGFGFEAAGLYDVNDAVSVKAALGLSFFGKPKLKETLCIAGHAETEETTEDEKMPMRFSAYVGGQYAFEVSKQIKVSVGAGLDMSIGKLDNDDDAETLFSLGIGGEVAGSYAVNKNIEVLLGARYSYYFVNSCKTLDESKKDAEDLGYKFSFNSSALRIFAGCTYKI